MFDINRITGVTFVPLQQVITTPYVVTDSGTLGRSHINVAIVLMPAYRPSHWRCTWRI